MLEKIKNLKWYFHLIILVAVAALIFEGERYLLTDDVRAETATLNNQVSELLAKNKQAQIDTARINEFRALYASKAAEYDELKVLLPEQQEITNVLQGLQDTANRSKMTVMRFAPREATMQDSIMEKKVEIEVDSNFNNLRAFFESMAKLPRIVSIKNFKLNQIEKQTEAKTIHASFFLIAYYAAPTDINGKPIPPAGAPGAPAPAGQPAPAAAAPAAVKTAVPSAPTQSAAAVKLQ